MVGVVSVIGSGPSGISAALELAKDNSVLLIEQAGMLGGKLNELSCKGEIECLECGVCSGLKLIDRVKKEKKIEIMLESKIVGVSFLESKACLRIEQREQTVERLVDGIVLATGHDIYKSNEETDRVISGARFEREFRLGIAHDFEKGEKVAFVQCHGSRDRHFNYCSRVCCKHAARFAKRATEKGASVTVFYLDLRDKKMREIENVRYIRAKIGEFVLDNNQVVVRYTSENEEPCEDKYDRIILSTGLLPSSSNQALASMFRLELVDGFAERSYAPLPIVTAGTLRGPMDIIESINSGYQSAKELMSKMNAKRE